MLNLRKDLSRSVSSSFFRRTRERERDSTKMHVLMSRPERSGTKFYLSFGVRLKLLLNCSFQPRKVEQG